VLSFPLDRARVSQVLVDPEPDPASAPFAVTRERLAGYRDATTQPLTVAVAARNSAAEGARLAAALLGSGDPPDAIAAMSDELALGALSFAPDLAITGWDDGEAAERAGLTTVWQSLHDQGAACARVALGMPPPTEPPPWRIVRRESTMRPRP
jgi:DNA-binding LacI/PurR family transcriptional regulator